MRPHLPLAATLLAGCTTAALAQPRPQTLAPPVVILRGRPEATSTEVVLQRADGGTVLGRFPHLAASARHAALLPGTSPRPVVLAVAADREAPRGGSYHSALFRVDPATGAAERLCGGLVDGSRPLVTARGTVVVQRGDDGPDPEPVGRRLVQRTDALRLDVVDPATGAARTAWSGRGQLAWLATALRGDEVLVYHLHDGGSALLVLDLASGRVETLHPAVPLARDFSYDAARDEVVFARAVSPEVYEVASLRAHAPGAVAVRWRGASDHLMPRVLRDGVVGLSLPGDRGLAWLPRGSSAQSSPVAFAPRGDGSDALLAESADGRWVALRHTTARDEALVLSPRGGGASRVIGSPDEVIEFVGFAPAAGSP